MSADRHLARLLELRLATRGNPEGRAIVDRCLLLIARAQATSNPLSAEEIEREITAIADELALRYGAPKGTLVN